MCTWLDPLSILPDMSQFVTPVNPATLDVILQPMQIRTFQITVEVPHQRPQDSWQHPELWQNNHLSATED